MRFTMGVVSCKDLKLDPVHTRQDPYGHHINLKSFKTSMTLKFVIILQNLIKAYHRKSGRSKYDRTLTELDVETTRIRSCVNGVLIKTLQNSATTCRAFQRMVQPKARFPLGEFVRATRSENKNPAT